MHATGIVVVHEPRRFENLKRILADMAACQHIDDIIVWNNANIEHEALLHHAIEGIDNVTVSGFGVNLYTLGRFLAAEHSANPVIATQDDDCVVSNWDELFKEYSETDGTHIVCNLTQRHYEWAKAHYDHHYVRNGEKRVAWEAMVGFGGVFTRSMVTRLDAYRNRFGTDELLKRKADRVFAILQDTWHVFLPRDVEHLPGAYEAHALYRRRDHVSLNNEAYKRCLELLSC